MSITSPKKEKEKQFVAIEKEEKVKPFGGAIKEEKVIYFDGKQYVCKLPTKIMQEIWNKGDKLLFKLIFPKHINKEPELKIEYIKK